MAFKTDKFMDNTRTFEVFGGCVDDYSLLSSSLSNEFDGEFAVFPGFCDVHVHFREPGFSYKETIKSGSMSAAAGGYTAVCAMPNLSPVPDCRETLAREKQIIDRDAVINVYPYGSITRKQAGAELSDMSAMKDAIAFSDDGRGVQSEEVMIAAMEKAKSLGKLIVAHCEVNELLRGGYVHDGRYAAAHSHRGISSESEYAMIERDLKLAKKIGVKYHVCHISAKESVELIRKAKREGVDVTCETAPHYLTMDDGFLQEDGRFKMNPPLRDRTDRYALVEGVADGTIDMIATDHAPHSREEKSRGLEKSAFGVVGLETAFSACYTHLVKEGVISLDTLIKLLSLNPRERFGITAQAGYSVWKTDESYVVNPREFLSLGRATPYEGERLFARNYLTVVDGKVVYTRSLK